jgi:ribosomal protein L32
MATTHCCTHYCPKCGTQYHSAGLCFYCVYATGKRIRVKPIAK